MVYVLADAPLAHLLHRRPRALSLPTGHAPIASGGSNSCRVGYLPPTGSTCPFHGARFLRASRRGEISWLPRLPWDSQSFGHPDELSQRSRPHFLHDVAAMDLDGLFCSLQFGGDLLVEHPEYNTFHYFALARGERFIAPAQIFKLCTLLA